MYSQFMMHGQKSLSHTFNVPHSFNIYIYTLVFAFLLLPIAWHWRRLPRRTLRIFSLFYFWLLYLAYLP